jgi:uncharacterized RDD family membrane protein YckC
MVADAGQAPVAASTPEGRSVRVAGLWRRLLASLVDGLILSPLLFLLGWLTARLTGYRLPLGPAWRVESLLEVVLEGGSMLYSLLTVGLLVLLLYAFLFLVTTGATPGLRLLRLRVISIYGDTPEWWRALLRCGGWLLGLLVLGLGFVWIGFDREKRGLHDWMAGTYVIRTGSA